MNINSLYRSMLITTAFLSLTAFQNIQIDTQEIEEKKKPIYKRLIDKSSRQSSESNVTQNFDQFSDNDLDWWRNNLLNSFKIPYNKAFFLLANSPKVHLYFGFDSEGNSRIVMASETLNGEITHYSDEGNPAYNIGPTCPKSCNYMSDLYLGSSVGSIVEIVGNQKASGSGIISDFQSTQKKEVKWDDFKFYEFAIDSSKFRNLQTESADEVRIYIGAGSDKAAGINIVSCLCI